MLMLGSIITMHITPESANLFCLGIIISVLMVDPTKVMPVTNAVAIMSKWGNNMCWMYIVIHAESIAPQLHHSPIKTHNWYARDFRLVLAMVVP